MKSKAKGKSSGKLPTPSSQKEVNALVLALFAKIEEQAVLLVDVFRRLELVEKGQGFLAKRQPPRIPPFPRELITIGYPCPEGLKIG